MFGTKVDINATVTAVPRAPLVLPEVDVLHLDKIKWLEDLLESTGRQIRLARMLGRDQPAQFLHHPLIRDDAGEKLSKKAASAPVRELRRAGLSAGETLGRAAFAVGLIPEERPVPPEELTRRSGTQGRPAAAAKAWANNAAWL